MVSMAIKIRHNFGLVRQGTRGTLQSHANAKFDVVLNCDCIYEPCTVTLEDAAEGPGRVVKGYPATYMLTRERRKFDCIELYLGLEDSSVVPGSKR
jgi:hypothetical protein